MTNTENKTNTQNFHQTARNFFFHYEDAKQYVKNNCKDLEKVRIRRKGSKTYTEGFVVVEYQRVKKK